jgi:hypothetical protein
LSVNKIHAIFVDSITNISETEKKGEKFPALKSSESSLIGKARRFYKGWI